jgi:8-oxo-dGTP pyrophosphatase MutT (NUDIX family)
MTPAGNDAILRAVRRELPSEGRRVVELEGFRRAGVLVPVILDPAGPQLLLTRRTHDVETHKGQISFPGGMVDGDDPDIIQTSLREAREELGLQERDVHVTGLLDDLPTPTGFIITPVVGLLPALPPLTPNPLEVAEAFIMPVTFFCDPANGRVERRDFRGEEREVWFYQSGDRVVWGATAMIIRLFLTRLGLV